MTKKKTLALALCLCMLASVGFGACENNVASTGDDPVSASDSETPVSSSSGAAASDSASASTKPEEPERILQDEFLLGSWVAYYNPLEGGLSMRQQTEQLADAGINFIMYGSWINDAGESVERDLQSVDWWKYVDDVMVENGMKYMFSASGGGANNPENVKGALDNLSAEAVASAQNIVPNLQNCIGYMVKDEPVASELRSIANISKQYATIKNGAYPMVNMNPSTVGEVYGWSVLGGSYESYFDMWVNYVGAENIEYISHDHYAFGKTKTDMTIFNDMEIMRKVGLKYDLKTHGFPQACGWGGQRMPNADEIRWNVYAYLAYGFKAISYFNYVMWGSEGCYAGLIDLEGNIKDQQLYDDVAKMNWEIRATSDIIMHLDCIHAYHNLDNTGEKVELLPYNALANPPANADVIVSYMTARDGSEPYLMIFNKSFENEIVDMPFELGKGKGITGLEAFDPSTGEYQTLAIENETFKLSLKKGEGKFIRLSGDVKIS